MTEGQFAPVDPPRSVPLISHIEGNLWQGGCLDGVTLRPEIRHVISLTRYTQYKVGECVGQYLFPMIDGDLVLQTQLARATRQALECLAQGPTLIHCRAGLNRSGLVAASVLMELGRTADEAIGLLRERRHPQVLFNQHFERYLRARG